LNSRWGIALGSYCSSNTLCGNSVSDNHECGIWLSLSDYNQIYNNNVSDNECGIWLGSSNNNQIYNNNFINNTTQAHDGSGDYNVFNLDKPIGGNYWSNWTNPDTDSDGFVDFPYVFTGGQDDLPWADPDGWVCRDPGDMIQELADQVMALNLQHGISNSLDSKLDAALQALEDINKNNDIAAINTLEAFINAVEAQRDGKITDADADALIAKAQKIIDCLN
jgi:parallel beta-helix repeat protein